MTEWILIISYFLTNSIRLFLGLFLAAAMLNFSLLKRTLLFAAAGGIAVTALQIASFPSTGILTFEIAVITAIAYCHQRKNLRICLFLIFFYEIGAGLWDFLFQAGLGIMFRSERFISSSTIESLIGIWLSRLLILILAIMLARKNTKNNKIIRPVSAIGISGMFFAVALSQQKILPLNEDLISTWIIQSMLFLFAVMIYRISRQHEMELEIAQLKQEQAGIIERDYQTLRRTYEDNAKLYHDLHNHIETIYQCIVQGNDEEALRYCEQLRTPAGQISQTPWTGNKTTDCLISSKLAMAEQKQIRTAVNIEYPHNTNIRNADLTAILGNLLDNAIEAASQAPENLRFIRLTIRRINDMLIIKVENGYGVTPKQENGTLVTSKTDAAFHGWGLKSAQTAADRCSGTITTNYKDGVFQSIATLSFQPVRIESLN